MWSQPSHCPCPCQASISPWWPWCCVSKPPGNILSDGKLLGEVADMYPNCVLNVYKVCQKISDPLRTRIRLLKVFGSKSSSDDVLEGVQSIQNQFILLYLLSQRFGSGSGFEIDQIRIRSEYPELNSKPQ